MSTPARFLMVGAIAALLAGWLWLRHDGAKVTESAPVQPNEPSVVTRLPVPPTVVTERNVVDVPPSTRAPSDDEMTALVRKLVDRTYPTLGSQLVEHLVSKGLSRTDSERAVAGIMPDWVRCQVDATLAQAEEQAISRAAVLAVLDAQGLFAVPAQLDARAAITRAQPCRFSVQQRIGIFPGEFGF